MVDREQTGAELMLAAAAAVWDTRITTLLFREIHILLLLVRAAPGVAPVGGLVTMAVIRILYLPLL